jgi:hypothetical protein
MLMVNGLACFTLRGAIGPIDVPLDSADRFSAPMACQCDYLYSLEKAKCHDCLGFVNWARRDQIKEKVRSVLRLL